MEENKCSICGCLESESPKFYYNSIYGKNLCNKHYLQMRKYGHILEKTRLDDTQIEIKDTYAELILKDTYANEINRTLIDIEDVDKIKAHKWFLGKDGYVRCKSKDLNIKLHQYILGEKSGFIIDHINRNKLDNRKENLRYATLSQNGMNKSIQSNNTSGYVGVGFRNDRNKWYSFIQVNRKHINLGVFVNLKDAIKARMDAEIKYFGEYTSNWEGKYEANDN